DVVNFISHGILKDDQQNSDDQSDMGDINAQSQQEMPQGDDRMDNFTTNLNQLARQGKIDPLIGRQAELERKIQVLCRRRKNNPLLVGESGVGKKAIEEGLAWRIEQNDVPVVMKG
ncbi:ATP-dependent Clp protease ATP-binding subunit ClpA, partial [Proteus mirabilis]|nr:ATP-dependent Clp protease ATP-binding subunit ClpA [Proteus mirabilis]